MFKDVKNIVEAEVSQSFLQFKPSFSLTVGPYLISIKER